MRFVLEIDCDGPAFKGDVRREVDWLLDDVMGAVEDGELCGVLLDSELHRPCGTWSFVAAPGDDPDMHTAGAT